MHVIISIAIVVLFWRAIKMMDAYFTRKDYERNLWRLLFLAFIGAILRKLIERKPGPDFDGNAYTPPPGPKGPMPPDFDFDGLFQKAIESVKSKERVG